MLIAMAANKFGCRPSDLVVIHDPVLALDFDLAATVRLLDAERRALAEDGAGTDEWPAEPAPVREFYW